MPARVAIVGRPNVGKSRLFNRLAGRRLAIVHDRPGVTRDVQETALGDFVLLDTGGLGFEPAETEQRAIALAAENQVFVAVQSADLILFVVDGREGLTALDEEVSEHLRRSGRNPLLVVNKIDEPGRDQNLDEFAQLGWGDGLPVSAEHDWGIDHLREAIRERLGRPDAFPVLGSDDVVEELDGRIRVSFLGRPNVGKSSLCNRLLAADRLVVSEVPGTTRDAIELDLDPPAVEGEPNPLRFRLIDTAGLRKRTRVDDAVEYFSTVRTEAAMKRSDVVFLVLDAMVGVTQQDKNLAGEILAAGRSLIIVVNKWDLAVKAHEAGTLHAYEGLSDFRGAFEAALRREMFFLPDSPVIFTSALTGMDAGRLLAAAATVYEAAGVNIPTPKVNQTLARLMQKKEPRVTGGKRLKVYYAVQTGHRPFRFRLFCNHIIKFDDAYRRYLERGFVNAFKLRGTPVWFDLVGKDRPPKPPKPSKPRPEPRKKGGRRKG